MIPIENNLPDLNNNQANEIRQILPDLLSKPIIENMNNYIKPNTFPIIFEEVYVRQQTTTENNKKSIQLEDVTVNYWFILV